MSGFELLPLSGGAPVPIPPGETVLGRGPLLGISDKRVSRNHALLENQNGRLRLKSTHVNPVFLKSGSNPDPSPLLRDQWAELQTGDTLSLLPGQLCYRVLGSTDQDQDLTQHMDQDPGVNQSQAPELDQDLEQKAGQKEPEQDEEPVKTPRNSQAFEEGTKGEIIDPQQTPPLQRINQSHSAEESCSAKTSADWTRNQSRSPPRTRVLPAWMMSVSLPQASSSSLNPGAKRGKTATTSRKQTAPSVTSSAKKTSVKSSSSWTRESEEEEEEQEEKKKKRKRMNGSQRASVAPAPALSPDPAPALSPEPAPALSPDPAPALSPDPAPALSPDPARALSPDPSPALSPDPSPAPTPAPSQDPRLSRNAGSGRAPAATKHSSTNNKRPPCPYGKECYRKNPLHFQEQSHPGDQDYEDSEQDQESDQDSEKPECPYGTDCYRKNPLHRKEFSHTKRPARKTRAAAPRRRADDEDEDEDEDEYESSFIDSESDYEPPAQRSSSESEDLSQLQQDATRFVRGRK